MFVFLNFETLAVKVGLEICLICFATLVALIAFSFSHKLYERQKIYVKNKTSLSQSNRCYAYLAYHMSSYLKTCLDDPYRLVRPRPRPPAPRARLPCPWGRRHGPSPSPSGPRPSPAASLAREKRRPPEDPFFGEKVVLFLITYSEITPRGCLFSRIFLSFAACRGK